MSGGQALSDLLGKISENVKTLGEGKSVKVTAEDTVESVTDKIDQMLPYPGIDQTRATATHYAAELIRRRDEVYREQGLLNDSE